MRNLPRFGQIRRNSIIQFRTISEDGCATPLRGGAIFFILRTAVRGPIRRRRVCVSAHVFPCMCPRVCIFAPVKPRFPACFFALLHIPALPIPFLRSCFPFHRPCPRRRACVPVPPPASVPSLPALAPVPPCGLCSPSPPAGFPCHARCPHSPSRRLRPAAASPPPQKNITPRNLKPPIRYVVGIDGRCEKNVMPLHVKSMSRFGLNFQLKSSISGCFHTWSNSFLQNALDFARRIRCDKQNSLCDAECLPDACVTQLLINRVMIKNQIKSIIWCLLLIKNV